MDPQLNADLGKTRVCTVIDIRREPRRLTRTTDRHLGIRPRQPELAFQAGCKRLADVVGVAHTRWCDARLQADVVVLESLLANDLTFHSPIGTTSTKAEFVERVRSGFLKYNSVAAEEPLIRLHGDTAIVTGRANIQFRAQGQPRSEGLY
jgi:hypothetical protein